MRLADGPAGCAMGRCGGTSPPLADPMNLLEQALRDIVADLESMQVAWALVGGLAVGVRAEPRTTRDVDVVVSVATDAEAEGLLRELQSRGYRIRSIVEHDVEHRLATARLGAKQPAELLIDLLFASSGIEPEIVSRADSLEILPGFVARVARIGDLVALKVLARDDRTRPQDLDDIRALLAEATPEDIDEARSALALIARRGYGRGRALIELFEEVVGDFT